MPRVITVKRSQKAQGTCHKCSTPIKKGDPYKFIKPRYGAKKVLCAKCQFRDSDLTSSDKLARAYDARDDLQAAIAGWDPADGDIESLKEALTTAQEAVQEVADEYQESADNIHNTFSESQTADDCEEKANSLGDWAQELESAADDLEEFDEETVRKEAEEEYESEHPKPEVASGDKAEADWLAEMEVAVGKQVEEKKEEWGEEQRSKAEDPSGNCPV